MPEETPAKAPVKPGIKSTEFWVSIAALAAIIGGQFTDVDVNATTQATAAAVASIYSIVRAFTKVKT